MRDWSIQLFRMKKPTPLRLAYEIVTSSPRSLYNMLFGCPIRITPDQVVMDLLGQGFSFVRWGDGETAIVRKKSISYQEFSLNLSEKLENLSSNPPGRLVFGLPWVAYASPFDRRWNKRIFGIMFSTRVYWAKKYRNQFLHVTISRTEFWWEHANQIPTILQRLQDQGRKLILVGSSHFLAICPPKTQLIELKKSDAFSDYETLCKSVNEVYYANRENLTLIVSAGPTAKALVNDFGNLMQVLDIGHGLNFALNGFGSWAWSKSETE